MRHTVLAADNIGAIESEAQGSTALNPGRGGKPGQAAQGPIPEPVSVTGVAASPIESPGRAQGRRTLSTAFVRVGPDGHLTVELRDGRVLVLRDVIMRQKDYCGIYVLGGKRGTRFCGSYADIAAARPGGGPV